MDVLLILTQLIIVITLGYTFLIIGKIIVKKSNLNIRDVQIAKNFLYIFFIYKGTVIVIDILFDVNLDFIKYLSNNLLVMLR